MFKIPLVVRLTLLRKIATAQPSVSERRLHRAYAYAAEHQFSRAITLLKRIKPDSSVYLEAQKSLLKYREASHLQSQQWFNQAATQVSRNNFSEAVRLLHMIPQEAHIYAQAQAKLADYQQTIEQICLKGGLAGIR